MNRILKIAVINVLTIILILTVGCSGKASIKDNTVTIEGTVMKVDSNKILLSKKINISAEDLNKSVDQLVNGEGYDLMWITNNSETKVKVGDKVSILIQGEIAESYPAQANTKNIQIISMKDITKSSGADIQVGHLKGKYDAELEKLQQRNKEEGKVYYFLIHNKEELQNNINKYNLKVENNNKDYVKSEEFFKDNLIIAVFPEQVSDKFNYAIENIKEKNGWVIDIEKRENSTGEDEKANRVLFIEMKKSLWEKWQKISFNIYN